MNNCSAATLGFHALHVNFVQVDPSSTVGDIKSLLQKSCECFPSGRADNLLLLLFAGFKIYRAMKLPYIFSLEFVTL